VGGSSRTLIAVATGGQVTFGTIDSGAWAPRGPAIGTVLGDGRMALSATPGGGAALLTTDGSQIKRYDLDVSSGQVVVTPGLSVSANAVGATDQANALWFDGTSNRGFVGGSVLGDIYTFDARLDAGQPTVFDAALVSNGRLAPPVSGIAAYVANGALYLLAANNQGITIYDLRSATPQAGAFRVIPQDDAGQQITSPAGVAVTNLPAGAALPQGVIAVGDRTLANLALVRWDDLAGLVDGGLVIDPTFDPRGDGGFPDGGLPDGGDGGGGGGGAGPPSNTPVGPGIPVDHGSSCSTAAGGPALLAALAGLLLLVPRRRQRR
jgi:MYXO-CTERM domain-containing protein